MNGNTNLRPPLLKIIPNSAAICQVHTLNSDATTTINEVSAPNKKITVVRPPNVAFSKPKATLHGIVWYPLPPHSPIRPVLPNVQEVAEADGHIVPGEGLVHCPRIGMSVQSRESPPDARRQSTLRREAHRESGSVQASDGVEVEGGFGRAGPAVGCVCFFLSSDVLHGESRRVK